MNHRLRGTKQERQARLADMDPATLTQHFHDPTFEGSTFAAGLADLETIAGQSFSDAGFDLCAYARWLEANDADHDWFLAQRFKGDGIHWIARATDRESRETVFDTGWTLVTARPTTQVGAARVLHDFARTMFGTICAWVQEHQLEDVDS